MNKTLSAKLDLASSYRVGLLRKEDLEQMVRLNLFPNAPFRDPSLWPVLLSKGHSFSVRWKGLLVGVGGIIPLWNGVGEVWMCAMEDLKRSPLTFTKMMKRLIEQLEGGFHRIQMTVSIAEPGHLKWAKLLGFQEEGTLVRYGPDRSNHVMLSITWPTQS